MKHIWAPWRMEYIEKHPGEEGCLFCKLSTKPDDPESLVVHRAEKAFVVLNRYPYNNGHIMIVPYDHQPSLEGLSPATLSELMRLAANAITALRETYHAENFNVGINIGAAAGAGVVEHVHIHVVPRWSGDTNFMSTTADTRVMPEALEKTYERLRDAWRTITSRE